MNKVLIAGTGMTQFGKQIGRGLRSMAVAAIDEALADAGIPYSDVSRIFFGNAAAGNSHHEGGKARHPLNQAREKSVKHGHDSALSLIA